MGSLQGPDGMIGIKFAPHEEGSDYRHKPPLRAVSVVSGDGRGYIGVYDAHSVRCSEALVPLAVYHSFTRLDAAKTWLLLITATRLGVGVE